MDLAQYLEREELTQAEFGAAVGITGATVSRIVRGKHQPNWLTMNAIMRVTKGAVMPNDFIVPLPAKARRGKAA